MRPKRILLTVALAVVLVAAVLLIQGTREATAPAPERPLAVDHLAKNPSAFTDQAVTVTGVVAAVVPDQNLFTVIDQAEYAACRVVTCSQYQVPIAFPGQLPQVEQTVTVTGQLTEPEPGRFLLVATTLEPSR